MRIPSHQTCCGNGQHHVLLGCPKDDHRSVGVSRDVQAVPANGFDPPNAPVRDP